MLAELDSITSDWKALFCAIGSLRVLFVHQTIRPESLSDIPAAAKSLADRMNHRTRVGSVVVVGMAFFFGRFFRYAPNTLQQTGCVLLIVALLYMLFQLVTYCAYPHLSVSGLTLGYPRQFQMAVLWGCHNQKNSTR
jgi:hypothetical protein